MQNILKEAIVDKKVFRYSKANNDSINSVHIAFGVDAGYVLGMGTAMTSIVVNNPNMEFIFHVFVSSIDTDDLNRLEHLAEQYQLTMNLYYVNNCVFNQMPTFGYYSPAIYNRLLIAEALRNTAEKVLYLDADIICLGNIKEFIETDLSDHIIAVVHDIESTSMKQIKSLQLKQARYFNSGVIYLNIKKWNEHDVSSQAMALIQQHYSEFSCPDQDALNILLAEHTLYVDRKWNVIYDLTGKYEELPAGTVFLHYTARLKPWCKWCVHPVKSYFIQYYEQSPWARISLPDPSSSTEMRLCARLLARERRYSDAIFWYCRYLITKMKNKL
ncbi:lipopolysaccharide biosynthesis glycosyltransferase [Sporomusaceae bacterium BoRhaA]|uniref:glycosyltransferase family 8 protein n=1 Tax=Pelorhabdus rhamnosifermentans TaxID=2772457 RepID=UPI001C05F570|nr:glycosyltransferase [Pelorhabdus rhamnosifermentans]MBU2699025.1 lipopolysaccharide biosynthesis glycosyltransferase [Pelorhabdus rhamnosifermentans]